MNVKFLVIIYCFCFFSGSVFGQSGWTREKSSMFLKVDYSTFSADKYYTISGVESTTPKFHQNSFNLYGEYGVSEKFTIIAAMPLFRTNSFEDIDKVSGIGDLKLTLKYKISDKNIPVSISIAPEFPTGKSNAFAKNIKNPSEQINLPTGDGEFNIWTTLAASKSFGKAYVSAFGAYNFRTKYKGQALHDQYQIGAEIGYNPFTSLWVNAKLRAQFSDEESQNSNLSFLRGDGTSYTLLTGEVFYIITKQFGMSVTYLTGGSWIAPFKNIYIAPYLSFGVIYEMK
jgi:hypothetical protein